MEIASSRLLRLLRTFMTERQKAKKEERDLCHKKSLLQPPSESTLPLFPCSFSFERRNFLFPPLIMGSRLLLFPSPISTFFLGGGGTPHSRRDGIDFVTPDPTQDTALDRRRIFRGREGKEKISQRQHFFFQGVLLFRYSKREKCARMS